MAFVSTIIDRIRAGEVAEQGYSDTGYCRALEIELVMMDELNDRSRHGWNLRSEMNHAGDPLVWVDTIDGIVYREHWDGAVEVVGR